MPTARIIDDPRLVQQLRAYLKRMGYHRDDHRLACWEKKEQGET